MTDIISAVIALVLIIRAVTEDVKGFRIPNYLIVTGMITGVIMLCIRCVTRQHIEDYLLGTLAGLSGMLILYAVRAVGAGDVKLFAVRGLLLGKVIITRLIAVSLISGAVIGIVELCIRKTRLVELGGYKVKVHGFHYAIATLAAYVVVLGYGIVVSI